MISANAQIGVAKAAFFPQISLRATGGGAAGQTTVFTSLLNSNLGTWGVGGQLTQPILEAGRLKGNLHAAESQQQQYLLSYKQAIQSAFRDVSDALIAYQKYHQVRVEQEVTVQDLSDSVATSLKRYRGELRPTSRFSTTSARSTTPNSPWRRTAATNFRVSCRSTRRSAAAGVSNAAASWCRWHLETRKSSPATDCWMSNLRFGAQKL